LLESVETPIELETFLPVHGWFSSVLAWFVFTYKTNVTEYIFIYVFATDSGP